MCNITGTLENTEEIEVEPFGTFRPFVTVQRGTEGPWGYALCSTGLLGEEMGLNPGASENGAC